MEINVDSEYLVEPKDKLIRYGPEVLAILRKEFNLDNKEDREKSIAIIQEWIREQDHFVKKEYSKGYIERCIATSKGSIERAKQQIDKMCTLRTLMPKYFQATNLKKSDIYDIFDKSHFAFMPKLTDEYYRVLLVKVKPNIVIKSSNDFTLLNKFFAFVGEYLKSNDCCRGYVLVCDIYDTSAADLLSHMNLAELQQFLPILTEGYGCKIKGIVLVTASKFIEGFIRLLKPLFSAKIASRIHAISTRKALQEIVHGDVLPEIYGGTEKPVEQLNDDLVASLSSTPVKELMKEMNQAVTDESKRHVYKFNEQYMGMPGTFKTLSLD